jgi:NADPH:quinone reductase
MRAMRAERFSGYEALKLVEVPKPRVTDGKVLVRIIAAGLTPLDHTILVGDFHIPEKPLILGNEGAGVAEEGGGADFPGPLLIASLQFFAMYLLLRSRRIRTQNENG